jgi:hypothetical protein
MLVRAVLSLKIVSCWRQSRPPPGQRARTQKTPAQSETDHTTSRLHGLELGTIECSPSPTR